MVTGAPSAAFGNLRYTIFTASCAIARPSRSPFPSTISCGARGRFLRQGGKELRPPAPRRPSNPLSQRLCRLRAAAVKLHLDAIAAAVVVVRAMQRLVHVADEVDDEHQRFPALLGRGRRDRAASGVSAKLPTLRNRPWRNRAPYRGGLVDGDVDVVPGTCFVAGAPHLVRPAGDRRHRLARTENFDDAGSRCGSELRFRDSGDQRVSFGSPGKSGRAQGREAQRQKGTHKGRG